MHNNSVKGFTLIELLVVIVIIGLLASVVLVSLSNSRKKARDARRLTDMNQIYTALNMYYSDYGCLPRTTGTTCPGAGGYSDANSGGWDYSSQGGFMGFLVNAGYMSQVPVDPVNNMTGDGVPAGTYAYRYYCYLPTYPAYQGLHLGYIRESDGQYVIVNMRNSGNFTDSTFLCQ
jgi:prepilin-type N-terminal cleavage/methylation domain-containing protein